LQPQWESRDQVKQRIGSDKWNNNPTPKNDHAALRKEKEAQLRDVQEALKFLESIDTGHVETASKLLKDKLQPSSSSKRYNGQRPIDYSRRVDWQQYPDPTGFGEWRFTGSWDVTEFFENNDQVKLDWYYTTGTVKTSLDHPTQGRTQLFAAKVDPQTYLSILRNPRASGINNANNNEVTQTAGPPTERERRPRPVSRLDCCLAELATPKRGELICTFVRLLVEGSKMTMKFSQFVK
jgi:hypothetical protein